MDHTTVYPEGLTSVLSICEIDALENKYGKDIDDISQDEIDSYLSFSYEDYL